MIETTWKNLQVAKYKSVQWAKRTSYKLLHFDLQIFSRSVYQYAQSLFYFHNFWSKFDSFDKQKRNAAVHAIILVHIY